MADLQPPPEAGPANGTAVPAAASEAPSAGGGGGLGGKRQRRPSVRLGDIGEQPAAIPHHEPYLRRNTTTTTTTTKQQQWKFFPPHQPHISHEPSSSSAAGIGRMPFKTRPLTNLVSASDDGHQGEALEIPVVVAEQDKGIHHHPGGNENLESPSMMMMMMGAIRRGSRDGRARRGGGGGGQQPVRRVRTNWISTRVDEATDGADLKSSGGEEAGDDGYRDYEDLPRREEDSESPSDRRTHRVRVSESRDAGPTTAATDAVEVDVPSETDGREWNNNGRCRSLEDGGVRAWLNGLGLGRYAPVFEIHEVDDDVLPLLTLEDLKDMGINAVGSRRKLYCAIRKLAKNFS